MAKKKNNKVPDEFEISVADGAEDTRTYTVEVPNEREVFGTYAPDDGDDWLSIHGMGVNLPTGTIEGVTYAPPSVDTPVQASDMQIRERQWLGTLDGIFMLDNFMKSYGGGIPAENELYARVMSNTLQDKMTDAMTTFVTPDVSDVVRQLGSQMPPDMLERTDLPYPEGFLVLGNCWPYMNYDDGSYIGQIPVRAMLWWEAEVRQPSRPSVPDEAPSTWEEDEETKPGIMMALFADWEWLEAIREDRGKDSFELDSNPPLLMVDLIAWTYDTWWESVTKQGDPIDQHHQSPHIGAWRKILLSLFRFMQEEIVVTEKQGLPRAGRRRLERSGIKTVAEAKISVIHLRRYGKKIKPFGQSDADDEREAKEMYWSHRWWRAGHDRTNWRTGVKNIRVRPHLVGPDDLPIVIKDRTVVSVDR